ncbi:MAG TPA: alkaline phosphatase family protein [Vicinamibacterales bacterium]|nr:alkaline phosphatase family protein [Vicinamibacterales bacterium]
MRRMLERLSIAATCVLFLFAGDAGMLAGPAQPAAPSPKLVVVIAVDQMRADYLTRYGSLFQHGLTRLMKEGAWYRKAAYPYLSTVTCAGHSTIGTGQLPYHHGMILNAWYDRATGKSEACTEDASVKDISYSGQTSSGDSPHHMEVPTLAELMRKQTQARVVTMSLKARSAIGLAGHDADGVLWFDGRGSWSSSTAYPAAPPAFMADWVHAHPVAADAGKVWDRTLPASRYQNSDDMPGERASGSWTTVFPHPLGDTSDRFFYAHWEESPFADEYLERMAEAAVDALHLGHGDGTDFLGVSFSTLDIIGHSFGPRSQEVQDELVRLDATLGRLLAYLDEHVGAGQYVLGFTADHGVADIPEQVHEGGRESSRDITNAINGALKHDFGDGPFVAASAYTDLYFAPGIYERLQQDPKAMKAVINALRHEPGIARVLRAEEISTPDAAQSKDPEIRAAALSYYPGRSGDLILIPREGWLLGGGATTHGTLYSYDQRVPLILFGDGIRPGVHDDPSMPPDVVATLASIIHLTLPATDGHVLQSALALGAGAGAGGR